MCVSVTGHAIWKPVTLTKGPFTLRKFFGTARIKLVRVPKKYSTDTSFYTYFFSAMLTTEITFWYGCRAQVFGKSWFYTTNFIRAGLVFLVRVPILPVLGLPFQ